jgi:hypothetical protein
MTRFDDKALHRALLEIQAQETRRQEEFEAKYPWMRAARRAQEELKLMWEIVLAVTNRWSSAETRFRNVRYGPRAGGKARAAERHSEHSKWQKVATEIWAREPELKTLDVARRIKKLLHLAYTPKHIARYIQKP